LTLFRNHTVAVFVNDLFYTLPGTLPVGVLPLVLPLQLVLAGWVVRGVLTLDPRPLLRNLMLAFGGSFLALYGWYFLLDGLGDGGGLGGVGNLLYLLAGLLVVPAVLAGGAPGAGGVRRERVVQGVRVATGALGTVLFVSAAALVGYRAMPVPPEAQTLGPPDQPPLS
jgi:hypothetical protein